MHAIRCALGQHATTDLATLGQLWAWQGKYMPNIHPVQLQNYITTKIIIKLNNKLKQSGLIVHSSEFLP